MSLLLITEAPKNPVSLSDEWSALKMLKLEINSLACQVDMSLSLTCVSVSMSEVATSKRLGLDRYLLSLNWFSSSSSCWLVKAVRGLRHFPNRPDWGPAGGRRAQLSDLVHNKWIEVTPYLTSARESSLILFPPPLCSDESRRFKSETLGQSLFIQHQGHRKFNVMWWVGQAHISTLWGYH